MFKNWKTICQVPEPHMMWGLALLDLNTDFGRMIAEQLPQYFSQEEIVGPYPLSLMREEAQQEGRRQGANNGEDFIVSFDAVPSHIPVQTFDINGRNVAGLEGPKLPAEINPEAQQGETVTWQGKQFVVLENNSSCEELSIAPAELVHVDC